MGANTTLYREIAKAKQKKKPLIIVEGVDDKKFYENILIEGLHIQVAGFKEKCTIRTIQEVTTTRGQLSTSGCTAIISEFTAIQAKFINDNELEQYCIGIIDRDAFYYLADAEKLSERNSLKGIFTLQYYSFESYGLTKENIRYAISKYTKLSISEVNDDLLENIWEELEGNVFGDLMYIGLDCLKHAQDASYKNIFEYGEAGDFANIRNRKPRIDNLDKEYLDNFAHHLITNGYDIDIKKIVKGKHLLKSCASYLAFLLKNQEKCCKGMLTACAVLEDCVMKESASNLFENVSCKLAATFSTLTKDVIENIYQDLIYTIALNEVTDILNQFRNLKFNLA